MNDFFTTFGNVVSFLNNWKIFGSISLWHILFGHYPGIPNATVKTLLPEHALTDLNHRQEWLSRR